MKRHTDPSIALRLIGRTRAAQSKAPLAVDQQRDLAIGFHSSLEAIRTGNGTEGDATTLAMASNVALILCELGLGGDRIESVKEAQGYIVALMERGAGAGRYAFSGPGLTACVEMLAIHDAQLESPDCTEGLMVAALCEIRKRMRLGAVLEVAA